MKKIIAILSLLAASPAFATAVCVGDTTAKDKAVTAAATNGFMVNSFTQKCSANVFLDYAENTINVSVGAASAKGKSVFAGSSAGGAVAPTGTTCPSTGCTAAQSSAAATAALPGS